ncbi:MAG: hypothetical protein VYA02_07450, partial [Planctomycetota bacterium]|nr:hypothetical protein [Planctomycetota bacterium]
AANKRRNPAERLSNLPNPECTMAFVVEEQRFTLGAIGVSSSGWGGSEVSFNQKGYIVDPLSRVWIDLPALWNPDGVNISYMDGRVDYYTWQNPGAVKRILRTRLFTSSPEDDTNNWVPGDAIPEDTDYFRALMAPGLGNAFFPADPNIASQWPICP